MIEILLLIASWIVIGMLTISFVAACIIIWDIAVIWLLDKATTALKCQKALLDFIWHRKEFLEWRKEQENLPKAGAGDGC